MNLKNGDRVKVDNIESDIETSWGQGAHRAYKLKDGRVLLDLTIANLVTNSAFKDLAKALDAIPHETQEKLFQFPYKKE